MGRDCGDIALYAGLAGGAEMVIVPEKEHNIDEVCDKIMQGRTRGKRHSIIILSEGAGEAREISEQKMCIRDRWSLILTLCTCLNLKYLRGMRNQNILKKYAKRD